jgi:hypothetical protein
VAPFVTFFLPKIIRAQEKMKKNKEVN